MQEEYMRALQFDENALTRGGEANFIFERLRYAGMPEAQGVVSVQIREISFRLYTRSDKRKPWLTRQAKPQ